MKHSTIRAGMVVGEHRDGVEFRHQPIDASRLHGDARKYGPRRAARVLSPTRDYKLWRPYKGAR